MQFSCNISECHVNCGALCLTTKLETAYTDTKNSVHISVREFQHCFIFFDFLRYNITIWCCRHVSMRFMFLHRYQKWNDTELWSLVYIYRHIRVYLQVYVCVPVYVCVWRRVTQSLGCCTRDSEILCLSPRQVIVLYAWTIHLISRWFAIILYLIRGIQVHFVKVISICWREWYNVYISICSV